MSKRLHINNDGTARSVASDRGIYTERSVRSMVCTSPQVSISTVAWVNIPFSYSSGGNWLNQTGDFVAPRKGKFRITCMIILSNATVNNILLAFNRNSTAYDSGNTSGVLYNSTFNSLSISTTGTIDCEAGDVIRAWAHHNGGSSSLISSRISLIVEELLEQVPYLVASGNGVVSDPRQGYVSINNDLTMSLNKPVNITTAFKAAITLGVMTNIDNIATVCRYGNQIIVTMAGNNTQTAAINTGNVLFTIPANSPFCPVAAGIAIMTPIGVNGGNCITFQSDGTFQFWGNTLPAGTSIGASISYFCKGE